MTSNNFKTWPNEVPVIDEQLLREQPSAYSRYFRSIPGVFGIIRTIFRNNHQIALDAYIYCYNQSFSRSERLNLMMIHLGYTEGQDESTIQLYFSIRQQHETREANNPNRATNTRRVGKSNTKSQASYLRNQENNTPKNDDKVLLETKHLRIRPPKRRPLRW